MPNWVYALDMAGSEVMTFTNRELVTNLSRNIGQIYTESFPMPKHNLKRFQYKHTGHKMTKELKELHDPIPFNLTIYKGAKAWKLPRTFVNFLLQHPVALKFQGIYKIICNFLTQYFITDFRVGQTGLHS